MRLVTGQEMAHIDKGAIEEYGIPGIVLMENAGLQVIKAMERRWGDLTSKRIVIMAGPGNNGGDGFVIARHLVNRGIWTRVFLVGSKERVAGDARVNLEILEKLGVGITYINGEDNKVPLALALADIVVDALLGTGFRGKLRPPYGSLIDQINASGRPVVAVDIPSGVDSSTGSVEKAVQGTLTVSFGLPKLGTFLFPGADYVGQLEIVDIGLPRPLLDTGGEVFLSTSQYVHQVLPVRSQDSHKGTYGHLLLLAGSPGMAGAAVLAARGALRAGVGLVSIGVPPGLETLVAPQIPEAMVHPLTGKPGQLEGLLARASAVALGPGLGQGSHAYRLLETLLDRITLPLVIDADGLNILAQGGYLDRLPRNAKPIVFTPHPGEMARLTGLRVDQIQANRLAIAREYAQKWGVILVLKGAQTVIAGPQGQAYLNPTGNPGMATGGSGDVLTGVIGSLLAQGMAGQEAAVAGVYLHGQAGDLAAGKLGMEGVIAGDLADYLPLAFGQGGCLCSPKT
ncbi:MAG: NAD(P)H-hydrate dehydratase [Limnochordia bacterium]|jgi:hydroxyethylthiazole kinase-like uncharacterized protein yjeF